MRSQRQGADRVRAKNEREEEDRRRRFHNKHTHSTLSHSLGINYYTHTHSQVLAVPFLCVCFMLSKQFLISLMLTMQIMAIFMARSRVDIASVLGCWTQFASRWLFSALTLGLVCAGVENVQSAVLWFVCARISLNSSLAISHTPSAATTCALLFNLCVFAECIVHSKHSTHTLRKDKMLAGCALTPFPSVRAGETFRACKRTERKSHF